MKIELCDTVLREKAVIVSDELEHGLYKAMIGFMHMKKGVGLAAPQIGIPLRFFVTDVPGDKPRLFINPEIVSRSIETWALEEGCLSLPGIRKNVMRPIQIKVKATDLKGRAFTLECGGLLARCIQHEYDHLDGVLFTDRAGKT
jgi:peptide deformylase